MLNILWTSFFIISFLSAFIQACFLGNPQIWTTLANHLFEAATGAFQIALNLTGMLCLWLGLLKNRRKIRSDRNICQSPASVVQNHYAGFATK